MGIVDKATKAAATAGALAVVVQTVVKATYAENGQIQTVKVFGIPFFDRRRMEARRARRKGG